MSNWETWANLVLQDLNAAHAARRLDPAEYRRRRLHLLQLIARATGAPTTRRQRVATPSTLPVPIVTVRRDRQPHRDRHAALRSWALGLWAAAMLVGAAWLSWQTMSAG
ncbi:MULTISPECIES: hypothetical protein [Xanthomonas]|uniref:Transmembrane protein n=1 Tax=Xanthomonas campestris pv. papavericola TaxID=487881 RepID=A0AAJ3CFF2_XANCA|nr:MULTISPECIES: hypothetical protein [Xanthomonas]MCC5067129.1 hypothetical protein [Xanthomonas campestris]MCC5086177.1 hypothetical protein [Xanthomonas campestris]MCW2003985.1 hypothetical protein [Xanthomonas campestris]MCW2039229.1 hypothetical protein [Xanthomonas campestris]MEA0736387.1 hypothetical protein [Xanthomonas campestris pv. campestris]